MNGISIATRGVISPATTKQNALCVASGGLILNITTFVPQITIV